MHPIQQNAHMTGHLNQQLHPVGRTPHPNATSAGMAVGMGDFYVVTPKASTQLRLAPAVEPLPQAPGSPRPSSGGPSVPSLGFTPRDESVYWLLITRHLERRDLPRAVQLYAAMHSDRVRIPTEVSVRLARALVEAEDWACSIEVVRVARESGSPLPLVDFLHCLRAAVKRGEGARACAMYEQYLNTAITISAFNLILRAVCEQDVQAGVHLMTHTPLRWNSETYQVLIEKLLATGDHVSAEHVLQDLERSGLPLGAEPYTSLMSALADKGKLQDMVAVCKRMYRAGIYPPKVAFLIMVCGFAEQGDMDCAHRCYEVMKRVEAEAHRRSAS